MKSSQEISKLGWGLQGSVPVRLKELIESPELQLNVVLQASGELESRVQEMPNYLTNI